MKYFLGNVIAFLVFTGLLLWPIWALISLHWGFKLLLSIAVFAIAAYFVERVLSKRVNRIIAILFPDSKTGSK